jgi:hypothetical protein
MRRVLQTALTLLLLLSATALVEGQQRRSRRDRRSSPRSSLKTGDKAPDFKLHAVTKTGKTSEETLSLKDLTKDRPAALIFSSFT